MRLPNQAEIRNIKETATATLETPSGNVSLMFHTLPLTYDIESLRVLPAPPDDASEIDISQHGRLEVVRLIVESLEPDQIDFDTDAELLRLDPRAYYESCLGEFVEFGLNMKHLSTLVEVVTDLNNLSDVDIEEATKDLLTKAD